MTPASPWQALVALMAGHVLEDDVEACPERWRWALAYLERDPHPSPGSTLLDFDAWLRRVPETWKAAGLPEVPLQPRPLPQAASNRPAPQPPSKPPRPSKAPRIFGSLEAEALARRGQL